MILIKYLTALCFHFPISIEYCQLLKAKIYFPDLHLCNSGEVNITDHILCRGVSLVQNPEVGFLSQRHVHRVFTGAAKARSAAVLVDFSSYPRFAGAGGFVFCLSFLFFF